AALVVYDFVITLDREIKLFWTRRLTGATVLFFTIRYMPLLYGILGVVNASLDLPPADCDILVKVANTLDWSHLLPFAVFSAMRAYALTRNRVFTSIVLALSLVQMGLNFASYAYGLSGIPGPVEGCVSV
ncbi:hypothetical protein K466DRAFT_467551, partial [Polyporus arcularius HHB13444]